jgi:hypothetical protein
MTAFGRSFRWGSSDSAKNRFCSSD